MPSRRTRGKKGHRNLPFDMASFYSPWVKPMFRGGFPEEEEDDDSNASYSTSGSSDKDKKSLSN